MKLSLETPDNEVAQPGEIHLHLRFRPVSLIGIVVVLLIHLLLLYFLLHMAAPKKQKQGDEAASHNPITLILDTVSVAKKTAPAPQKSPPKPPKPAVARSKQSAPAPTKPVPVVAQTTVTPAAPIVEPPPQQDMMSMANAARARRQAQEQATQQDNPPANQSAQGMSPQEVAEANVKHSMQQAAGRAGANGVFQILSKSTRVGSFSFRGWRANSGSSWKQVIEVDAGLGGNIELAMVRRMIELIRSHYPGDFSWESRRLGRVVTLSARPQDSAELENFLVREFF